MKGNNAVKNIKLVESDCEIRNVEAVAVMGSAVSNVVPIEQGLVNNTKWPPDCMTMIPHEVEILDSDDENEDDLTNVVDLTNDTSSVATTPIQMDVSDELDTIITAPVDDSAEIPLTPRHDETVLTPEHNYSIEPCTSKEQNSIILDESKESSKGPLAIIYKGDKDQLSSETCFVFINNESEVSVKTCEGYFVDLDNDNKEAATSKRLLVIPIDDDSESKSEKQDLVNLEEHVNPQPTEDRSKKELTTSKVCNKNDIHNDDKQCTLRNYHTEDINDRTELSISDPSHAKKVQKRTKSKSERHRTLKDNKSRKVSKRNKESKQYIIIKKGDDSLKLTIQCTAKSDYQCNTANICQHKKRSSRRSHSADVSDSVNQSPTILNTSKAKDKKSSARHRQQDIQDIQGTEKQDIQSHLSLKHAVSEQSYITDPSDNKHVFTPGQHYATDGNDNEKPLELEKEKTDSNENDNIKGSTAGQQVTIEVNDEIKSPTTEINKGEQITVENPTISVSDVNEFTHEIHNSSANENAYQSIAENVFTVKDSVKETNNITVTNAQATPELTDSSFIYTSVIQSTKSHVLPDVNADVIPYTSEESFSTTGKVSMEQSSYILSNASEKPSTSKESVPIFGNTNIKTFGLNESIPIFSDASVKSTPNMDIPNLVNATVSVSNKSLLTDINYIVKPPKFVEPVRDSGLKQMTSKEFVSVVCNVSAKYSPSKEAVLISGNSSERSFPTKASLSKFRCARVKSTFKHSVSVSGDVKPSTSKKYKIEKIKSSMSNQPISTADNKAIIKPPKFKAPISISDNATMNSSSSQDPPKTIVSANIKLFTCKDSIPKFANACIQPFSLRESVPISNNVSINEFSSEESVSVLGDACIKPSTSKKSLPISDTAKLGPSASKELGLKVANVNSKPSFSNTPIATSMNASVIPPRTGNSANRYPETESRNGDGVCLSVPPSLNKKTEHVSVIKPIITSSPLRDNETREISISTVENARMLPSTSKEYILEGITLPNASGTPPAFRETEANEFEFGNINHEVDESESSPQQATEPEPFESDEPDVSVQLEYGVASNGEVVVKYWQIEDIKSEAGSDNESELNVKYSIPCSPIVLD